VKQIEQGPALETPIEILLTGRDLPEQAALVTKALATAGAYQVHDDAGVITHVDRERRADQCSKPSPLLPSIVGGYIITQPSA
jgi:hypothetical protein